MSGPYANVDDVIRDARRAWKPPPRLTLSEWADEHFYLSAESAAEPGRWRTLPYQRGIMDAMTDPKITQVSLMKSARVGYTKMLGAAIGYHMHQAPCPILVVQPTVEDAKGYSKEEIAPMIRDCPELNRIVFEEAEEVGPKDSGNTMLHKKFPGGVLSIVGANSGSGFRRISRRVVIFDEVDAYPPSAGSDGDQIKLGIKRSEYYWDRKIYAGSTPLVAGRSRIESMFEAGDQRRYYVPCPQCGHMDYFVFTERDTGGHWMQWPDGKPEEAHFVCSENGCIIEHSQKRTMVERGEWRAAKPFSGHASFHIWAAYSFSPNATWGQLAAEFLAAKDRPEELKTFVNTALGETWRERGDAPDWERIYNRREKYPIGQVPESVRFLTAGVDVQKDRVVYEVVGWAEDKESWSIDSGIIPFDTGNEAEWTKVDDLLNRTYPSVTGGHLPIQLLAVDSGFNTQMVYNWARRYTMSRVIAIKGLKKSDARVLIGTPSAVDVTHRGKRITRGYKYWPVGVDIAKAELYGWLRIPVPAPGYCHFPEYGEEFFKQLTAEQLVSIVNERTRHVIHEWQVIPGRENHWLDARVYARAAASVVGLDRYRAPKPRLTPAPEATAPVARPTPSPPPARKPRQISDSGFLAGRGKNWLKR